MAIIDYPITTNFHEKDWFHPNPHTGIDLAVPLFTPIISQDSGIVELRVDKWLGNNIRLKLENGDVIVYGHLSKFEVYDGQHINENQLIGLTGGDPNLLNQGHTSGAHIHISQYHNGQLVNPHDYLFNHEDIIGNNSSPFIFPIMLIILFIITWKFRRAFAYSIAIILGLFVIFIVS